MTQDHLWQQLFTQRAATMDRRILSLFETGTRMQRFSVAHGGLLFDFSKTNIDDGTLDTLIALAKACDWRGAVQRMYSGEKINVTENRAALHTALRRTDGLVYVEGVDVMPATLATRARFLAFTEAVRSGAFTGQGGRITDVINIGIGGSDLGPMMAYQALTPYADGPALHFVSNIDGAHIHDVLAGKDPATTLLIIASKTFTTIETMTNAQTALDWMAAKIAEPGAQCVALSSAVDKTAALGIPGPQVFGFEDWVGGRYSVWGPVGLSLAIAIGAEAFTAFLAGARAVDTHFADADPPENIPLLLALVGIWHHQICGYPTRAVLPYEQRLLWFPAYLQQLEMESNGKGVDLAGDPLTHGGGSVVWGAPGTNGQHAFYQLIHQGPEVVPCAFLMGREGHEPALAHHHRLLQANCLAQSEALMLGRDMETALDIAAAKGFTGAEQHRQAAHRVFPGNRPSTTLCYPKLTPYVLGQLIAIYEHCVYAEGVILGLNSFDQWGVELGKELATTLGAVIEGCEGADGKDPSTRGLLDYIR